MNKIYQARIFVLQAEEIGTTWVLQFIEKINKNSRVPAFITGKGIQKGTYSNMMHITDIQMTILDMIGHKRTGTKPVDGVSHWNELRRGLKTCRKKSKSAKKVPAD